MKTAIPLLCFVSLSIPMAASAVQTERLLIDSFQDWAEGQAGGTAIMEPGQLAPAPQFQPMADLKTSVIWSGAVEAGGGLLLATGKPGAVWRLETSGRLEKLSEFSEPDVYAVTAGPKGEIYAAPSPGGKIFRLGAKGLFEEYYQTGEEFVWDLRVSPTGILFAATGTKGRIHRITGRNEGQIWFDADEPHIRRLAFDSGGNLLAGSAGKGLLYRIVGRNQGVVLLDSGKDEIAGLALDAAGTIVVAATSGNGGGNGSSDRPRSLRITTTLEGSTVTSVNSPLVEGKRPTPSSPPKGSTDLYALGTDLFPYKIKEVKDDIVSLAAVGRNVYGASASDGRLYQITGGTDFAIMGEIEGKSVVGLLSRGTSLFALTQGQSQVWRASTDSVTGGKYTSRVIDAKVFARWGVVRVGGEGDWSVRTRSGNTADPDKSWYPWIPLDGGKSASPPARYLQLELKLGRGRVEQVEVFHLPQNLPPKIEALRVLAPGTALTPMTQPPPPAQAQTADQLARGMEGINLPPVRFQPSSLAGARSVVWQATDPNNDALEFSLYLQKEGENRWELLDEKIEEPVFSWDCSGWEDGTYRVRVVASDAPENASGSALETEKVSEMITIDHTPPTAHIRRKTPQEVDIEVNDRTSRLASAYVSYDGHDFRPILTRDGLCDSGNETYRIPRKEKRTLYFRVEDEHGNVTGLRVLPD